MFCSDPVSRLSTHRTRKPLAISASQRCEPRNPAPPVTTAVGIGRRCYPGPRRVPVNPYGAFTEAGVPTPQERLGRQRYAETVETRDIVATPIDVPFLDLRPVNAPFREAMAAGIAD